VTKHVDETGISDASQMPLPLEPRGSDATSLYDETIELNIRLQPFPRIMLVVGILWIVSGVASLIISLVIYTLVVPFVSSCFVLWIVTYVFIGDGARLIRGQIHDPRLNAGKSFLLSIFVLGWAYSQFEPEQNLIALGGCLWFGTTSLVLGVLALIGRSQYLEWKAEQSP
jgi:hypothetical protein